ncbi:MAG: SpaH/EbpB family LPXTG-anchored major pilin [Clostridium sp.]|nr:SpaH/EbpB family LPXTG-anchored major pilin [Clostridium sp.]
MKKILSFLMAALLLVGVCTAAIAENDGSITIQNATAGQTYAIYMVFDATYSENGVSYTYTKGDSDLFYPVLTGYDSPFVLTPTVVENVYNVTIKAGATAETISSWLTGHINFLTQTASQFAASSTVVFNNLPYGYYYVTSTLGAAVSIDTVTPNVTIIDKNQKPNLESKYVWNGTEWVPANSLNVGDVVRFQINAILTNYDEEKQIKEYVFTDIMANGFSPVIEDSIEVYVTPQGGSETEIDYFTYSVINDQDDPNDFTVTIPWATYNAETETWTSIYDASCEICIEYSATVLDTAVLGANGNNNKVNLSWNYVDGGGDEDPDPDDPETTTYVYMITINKVDANGNTPLAGAKFVLRKGNAAEGYKYLKYTPATEDTPAEVEWVTDIDEATVYTTDDDGLAIISGIAEGTYELVETKAPEGYNLLYGPVTVTVPAPAEEGQNHNNVEITVENSTGSELPSTGGIGTTIFYIVGGVLMVAAVVLFATKKRMSASKN